MRHDFLKQMGWRKGLKYVGDIMDYASLCYDSFGDFLLNEDYDITDESMDKEERYEIDGRYLILNRDLFEYVRDMKMGDGIKLVRFPVVEYFNPTLYNDQSIYNQIKTIDTIMFRSDQYRYVVNHLTYQLKKKQQLLVR